ncbi:MAG: antibiotic biosynthesis monooxygenase [SAR202 cluster bacterium]|nr:antibiotic biosynthesis monooxygenase [SAR202 cluster bacterium]
MLSIFVTINVKPGTREKFIEASYGDAKGSVRDEPGCFRFDIHQDSANPDTFYLYEVYSDEAAFAAHQQTPHYLKWRAAVSDLFDGKPQVVRMDTLFPSETGWRKQKPSLVKW